MAAFVKYESFIEYLCDGQIDLFGITETFKAVIHTDAPVAATDDALADLSQVTGTGYVAGGEDIQNDSTRAGDTVTMTAQDIIWTATAADWIQAQYVSIYDDTPTTPVVDPLMNSYDYGAPFTLGNGETFTLDFGASLATFA
jgi:hypothetical protein